MATTMLPDPLEILAENFKEAFSCVTSSAGQGNGVVTIPPGYGDLAIQIAAAFQNFLATKHLERSPPPPPAPEPAKEKAIFSR